MKVGGNGHAPPDTPIHEPGQMVALDSLRGLCACIVVLYHFNTTGVITNLAFVRGGWLFVDFFFVLSGFVIASAYMQRIRDGFAVSHFMLLRIGRIYPVHLATLLAFLVLELVAWTNGGAGLTTREAFSDGRTPLQFLSNLLLLQSLGLHSVLTWNGPSWSISAEIWTYLLAALVMKLRFAAALPIVAVAVVASCLFMAFVGTSYLDRSYDLGVIRCIYGFGMGMIAMMVLGQRSGIPSRHVATVIELVLAILCVWLVSTVGTGPFTLVAPLLFTMIVVVFARQAGSVSALLCAYPFRKLGAWSYSIYMIHVLIEARFIDALRFATAYAGIPFTSSVGAGGMKIVDASAPWPDLAAVAVLALVIGLARFSYVLIEQPCREWSRAYARSLRVGRTETTVPTM